MALIDTLEKRIYETKPTDDTNPYRSRGQYNWGKVDPGDPIRNMGQSSDNPLPDFDLYSVVFSKTDENEENYQHGYMNGIGNENYPSYIKFEHIIGGGYTGDTDGFDSHSGAGEVVYNMHYSFWIYDGYEVYSDITAKGSQYAVGFAGYNSGDYIKYGLAGQSGTQNNSWDMTYQNNLALGGNKNSADDDELPQDGNRWDGATPGHLMGGRSHGEEDVGADVNDFDQAQYNQFGWVDIVYKKVRSQYWACGPLTDYDWSNVPAGHLDGSHHYELWKDWDYALPFEYCFGTHSPYNFYKGKGFSTDNEEDYAEQRAWAYSGYLGGYNEGGQGDMGLDYSRHIDLEKFAFIDKRVATANQPDPNDVSRLMEWFSNALNQEADDSTYGGAYGSFTSTAEVDFDLSAGAVCNMVFWSEDYNCNQENDRGLIDGECPDEYYPFYCGSGLALQTRSDTYEVLQRGYPNEWNGNGVTKIDNFHLGWDQSDRPYNPPFNQKGPDREVPDGFHFSDYVRGANLGTDSFANPSNQIVLIVVHGADEREKQYGYSGRTDERDRQYARINIPKNYLYRIWKNQKGEEQSFNFNYQYIYYKNYQGDRETTFSSWESKIKWENGWYGGNTNGSTKWAKQWSPPEYDNEVWTGVATTLSQRGVYDYDNSYEDDRGSVYERKKAGMYRDTYGNSRGYDDWWSWTDNDKSPMTNLEHVRVKIKAPTFDPLIAIKPMLEGGMNANWIDKTKSGWWALNAEDIGTRGYRRGLNPQYNMDFIGFPSTYYSNITEVGSSMTDGKYFHSPYGLQENVIPNFRPISYIESVINPEVDLQGYYEGNSENDTLARIYSSAPNELQLSFRLAEDTNNSIPLFIDDLTDEQYGDFKYWFMVANWNWNEEDPGGGICEEVTSDLDCISELASSFPINDYDLQSKNFKDLYSIASVNDTAEINPNTGIPYETFIKHQYIEPGVKIVKVLVFTTLDISDEYHGEEWCIDIPCEDYSNFRQALKWKLVTMKINLNGEGVFPEADFGDLGGDDFVYLPMPDTINLEYQGIAPSGNYYKSSHPVISGLSEDSQYIKSLEEIYREDSFTIDEIDEKGALLRAKKIGPTGTLNKLGTYLGTSDLAQIRYFNSAVIPNEEGEMEILDMRKLLLLDGSIDETIDTIDPFTGDFHPYNDFDYWTGNPSYIDGNELIPAEPAFPEESPVGDIFISGYEQFFENCLFEFNLGDIDGKSVKDTSGSGNKGIFIGDYSITKDPGSTAVRDSFIKISEIESDDVGGAF